MYHKKPLKLSAWYAYCVLSELVLIYPVYLIMMEESGIGPSGLATLLAIWAGTAIILEIPSGVISDIFNRKFVLATGAMATACAFVVWYVWPTFWGFATGFVIWSLGGSLASGTAESYLYEVLDDDAKFQEVYARSEAFSSFSVAVALLVGGLVAEYGYETPLIVSAVAPILGAIIVVSLFPNISKPKQRSAKIWQPFVQTLNLGARTAWHTHSIRFIILVPATICALAGVMEEFIGVILSELSYGLTMIGVIYALLWLGRTVGSLIAERMSTNLAAPLILSLSGAVLLLVMAIANFALGIILGIIFFFATTGPVDVVFGARLQKALEDNHRATVTSVGNMGQDLVGIVGYFIFGAIAQSQAPGTQWFSLVYAYAGLGVIFSLFWIGRYYFKFQKQHAN